MSENKKKRSEAECAEAETGSAASAPKKNKKSKKVRTALTGVVVAVAVGAIAGLSVALYYSENVNKMQARYMRDMESVYSRSYHDLLDSANDLDVKLGKLNAAGTAKAQQNILYDVWSAANLAGNSLAAFQGGEEGVMKATKFVGQLGDYAHYLAERMEDGEPLSAEERNTLYKLREVAAVLKDALKTVQTGMDEGRLFLEDGGMLDEFTGAFDAFSKPDFEYPQMIYDGPFSDSLEDRDCKALKGLGKITEEKGAEILRKLVPSAENVEFYDRTESDIVTLNYSFDTESGRGFAQISEQGGLLVACNMATEQTAADGNYPEHCAAAIKFAGDAGYDNLSVVWCAASHGIVYVNLAPVQNGVVLYPDLIKVKVDESGGSVVGLDATHYIYNHTARDIPAPAISAQEAASKVILPKVSDAVLALIPLDETREVLTYEFECESNGTYFVYIDALTGDEANILYVIDSEQGTVLM